jgi:nucleoside-diphosphate-sugar epimerase
MKILVVGASGFIGGAIAHQLAARGDHVRVLLRGEPGAEAWRRLGVETARGTLGDPESIARAAEGMEHVVCAAGIATPRAAPRALRWTHIAGTENLVSACEYAGVRRLVFTSCADVTLVDADRVHWDERRALSGPPLGPRAQSLALAEELALAAAGPELEVVALRPAWVWGPGDTSRLPHLCREALQRGGLVAFETEGFLASLYIDNLVEAVARALEASDVSGRSFYLADPELLHPAEFLRLLSEAVGLPPPRRGMPLWLARPWARIMGAAGGLSVEELAQRSRSTLFDVNAAVGALAFEPRVRIEDGMRALGAWARAEGGPEGLAAKAKPPPDARSVDEQVSAAGGD